ncbi:MAG: PQQ-binding-like beta-propeller repeat protein [Candidatus Aminicenantes bacterium]|nr:PQQ-binding-like beta-propeller repeat protein [Candidatus Aminicenantes bacterium]
MKSKLFIFFTIAFVLVSNLIAEAADNKGDTNWPGFRGHMAKGIAEGFSTPVSWDIEKSKNIKWKIAIPGLGHSSPVIYGNRIFITTAISGKKNPEMKVGLYGNINPVDDDTVHEWKVFCIDKNSGKILWEKTAHKGVPEVKRHPKGTHSNSTPATDGKYVVAFFGSEGLFCYDMNGKLTWGKDFGVLESSFFRLHTAQWGFAGSPVIHRDVVVVQCDVLKDSFIAAFDIKTGKELWRTPRDEYPTWSTPTVHEAGNKTQIIVNGFKHIGGYDFKTGKEIWKMKGGGDIPVPTPVVAFNLVFINNAHGSMSPIYAVKLDAKGDISLKKLERSNKYIAWSITRGGAYMQTPLIYGDYLYNLRMNGSLSCYKAKTGERVYKEKIGKMDSFSASGVAAEGKLYFSSEGGNVYVVKAGADFKLLSTNPMKDVCMATPAISEGTLYFRTLHYLAAVSNK